LAFVIAKRSANAAPKRFVSKQIFCWIGLFRKWCMVRMNEASRLHVSSGSVAGLNGFVEGKPLYPANLDVTPDSNPSA
jgi:hypothetical protein